ncbi:sigma 54-interacting transcriptional regulator [Planctomycetaceae bacterium SH139]
MSNHSYQSDPHYRVDGPHVELLAGRVAAAMLDHLASEKTLLAGAAAETRAELTLLSGLRYLLDSRVAIAAGVVRQAGREWAKIAWLGPDIEPSQLETLVADAIDRGQPVRSSTAVAIPLRLDKQAQQPPQVLVLIRAGDSDSSVSAAAGIDHDAALQQLADLLTAALTISEREQLAAQRTKRLQAMLRIAAQWTNQADCEALLERIAAAAADLLGAERASIFLWDRPRRLLVGRPALGVADNRLEVSDTAGIVGAVLQSGKPRRWHVGDDGEGEINRAVDKQLKFETRSLLAVPLWETSSDDKPTKGNPIGVFELINRNQGAFNGEDEIALAELATQAAAAIRSTQTKQTLTENRDRLLDSVAESARVVGEHPKIAVVRETVRRVADTDLSVLILGENGTGKEVLARSVHFQSSRKHQPFVAVNCAALVETLLESELFGHEKGAFTDAHQTRPGKFEQANQGTLFLDEIGDLSLGGQAKLLRVLEERLVVRVGGSTPLPVDVRVIAATNQPLAEMVREKRFREDLFFRLNIVTIEIPPLRQRGDDIVLLTEHFLRFFADQVGRKPPRLAEAAKAAMLRHGWPGNIRELRNLVERVCYLCPQEVITASDLALGVGGLARADNLAASGSGEAPQLAGQSLADATRSFQAQHIENAIAECRGNMTDAADKLGLHRSNLYRKMRQLGVDSRLEDE